MDQMVHVYGPGIHVYAPGGIQIRSIYLGFLSFVSFHNMFSRFCLNFLSIFTSCAFVNDRIHVRDVPCLARRVMSDLSRLASFFLFLSHIFLNALSLTNFDSYFE